METMCTFANERIIDQTPLIFDLPTFRAVTVLLLDHVFLPPSGTPLAMDVNFFLPQTGPKETS